MFFTLSSRIDFPFEHQPQILGRAVSSENWRKYLDGAPAIPGALVTVFLIIARITPRPQDLFIKAHGLYSYLVSIE
jgi:hypothetical protein